MSHYTCKNCGLRYDDCNCKPVASIDKPITEITKRFKHGPARPQHLKKTMTIEHNRMWNAKNPNQGNFTKALCVCSAGLLRSPTLAWILSNNPFNMNTRAAGASPSHALIKLDEVLLNWADVVVFANMDNYYEAKCHFPGWLDSDDDSNVPYIVLDIPDRYRTRDPELIRIATKQLEEAFPEIKN